jgi:hypothetical protein
MALDGVIINVPDAAENVAASGRGGNHLADSPYPQARIVTRCRPSVPVNGSGLLDHVG